MFNGKSERGFIYEYKSNNGRTVGIKLEFHLENGEYELRSMYPEYRDGVYKYVKNVGWFKSVYDENTGKWKFVPEKG